MENTKETKMDLVLQEQTNPYYNEQLANNGGGYDQPHFKYAGVVNGKKTEVDIWDSSCGDFGDRFEVNVASGEKRLNFAKDTIDEMPVSVCEGTQHFSEEYKKALIDWMKKETPYYAKNLEESLQEEKLKNSRIIVLDTETTGFKADDEVLQVSIVDANGKELLNQYFKPEHKTSWENAEKVNHISPSSTKDKPYLKEHKEKIEKMLHSADLVVGYNTGFDMKMLEQNGIQVPKDRKYVDLMIPFAEVKGEKNEYGRPKWQKLVTCAKEYGFPADSAEWHNSLGDTMATKYCFNEMRDRGHITPNDTKDLNHLVGYNPLEAMKARKRVKSISRPSKSSELKI